MMNSLGSVFGPIVVSSLIKYTQHALFIVSALAFFILACWTVYRIKFHKVDREHFMPFVSVSKTTHEVIEVGIDEEEPVDSEEASVVESASEPEYAPAFGLEQDSTSAAYGEHEPKPDA